MNTTLSLAKKTLDHLAGHCEGHEVTLTDSEIESTCNSFLLAFSPDYRDDIWSLISDCAISLETYTWTETEIVDRMSTIQELLFSKI